MKIIISGKDRKPSVKLTKEDINGRGRKTTSLPATTNGILSVLSNSKGPSRKDDVIDNSAAEQMVCDVKVMVKDNGVGISKADQAHLFQPYSQVNADVLQGGKGSGLGLLLAKEIIALHGGTVVVENKVVAMPKTNVRIHVNAFKWGWGFTYPGQNAVVVGNTTQEPTMVMPVGTDVAVTITSTDVMHGFYIPQFNFSRYALPGVTNEVTFHAVKTGTFTGQCSQLCGLYHSLMYFKVKVVTVKQYTEWLHGFDTPAGKLAAQAAENALKIQMSAGLPVVSAVTAGVN